MEVVFIPQVTCFLPNELYLKVYSEAKETGATCSAVLRRLARKKFKMVKP